MSFAELLNAVHGVCKLPDGGGCVLAFAGEEDVVHKLAGEGGVVPELAGGGGVVLKLADGGGIVLELIGVGLKLAGGAGDILGGIIGIVFWDGELLPCGLFPGFFFNFSNY